MLPANTITYTLEINGTTTQLVVSPPYTILGMEIMQERTSSNTEIKDGNTVIMKNYALNTPYNEYNYVGLNNLEVVKSGNDNAFVLINYLPYNRVASSSLETNNFFSQGEALIAWLIFIIIIAKTAGYIINLALKYEF